MNVVRFMWNDGDDVDGDDDDNDDYFLLMNDAETPMCVRVAETTHKYIEAA